MAAPTIDDYGEAGRDLLDLGNIVNGSEVFGGNGRVNTRFGGAVRTIQRVIADGEDLLQAGLGYNYRGAWVTGTNYAVRDQVLQGGTVYYAVLAHVAAAAFATDLAAGKWRVYQGALLSDVTSAEARPVEASSWDNTKHIDFADQQFIAGMTPIPGVLVFGAPTVALSANGELEVTDADYSQAVKRVVVPSIRFREGILRIRFRRGKFMFRLANKLSNGYTMWSSGDGNVEVGWTNSTGTDIRTYSAVAMPGADGDNMWIEFLRGPFVSGATLVFRIWKEGDI